MKRSWPRQCLCLGWRVPDHVGMIEVVKEGIQHIFPAGNITVKGYRFDGHGNSDCSPAALTKAKRCAVIILPGQFITARVEDVYGHFLRI